MELVRMRARPDVFVGQGKGVVPLDDPTRRTRRAPFSMAHRIAFSAAGLF
jgi:hypothetical protein